MKPLVLCILLTGNIGFAFADETPPASDTTLSTDRPGILYGTTIVPTGHVQLEAGLPTWQRSDFDGARDTLVSTPIYLRYGVSESFEWQIADSPYNHQTIDSSIEHTSMTGAGDLQLGAKVLLHSGQVRGPTIVLVGYATLPTGAKAFTGGRPGYNLNLVSGWNLTGSTNISAMLSYSRTSSPDDRDADTGIVAVNLAHSFNARLAGYAEAGYFPGFSNAADTALAGAGVT
nr:transporter [Pseudomonadota bacterium]